MTSQTTLLLLTVGGYFLTLILLGLQGQQKIDREVQGDFYTGGRSFSWVFILMTVVASLFSAFTFVGLPGFFYSHGISALYLLGSQVVLLPMVMYVVSRKIWEISRKEDLYSPVEIMTRRYNKQAVVLFSITTLIFLIPAISLQIIGVAKLVSSVSNGLVSYTVAATTTLIVVVAYSRLGGMRAIVWSDALQGTLMLGLLTILAIVVMWDTNLASLFEQLTSQTPTATTLPGREGLFTPAMILSFALLFSLAPISYPYIAQRSILFKSKQDFKNVAIWFPLVGGTLVLMAMTIGLSALLMKPDLSSGDLALSVVLEQISIPILTVLVVVAILAAAMSSIDSMLIAADAIMLRDILNTPYCKKIFSLAKPTTISLLPVVCIAGLSLVLSLHPPKLIVTLGILAISGFAQLAPAYLASMYWKNATSLAAIGSVVAGLGSFLIFNFYVSVPLGFSAGFAGVIIATITIFLVSVIERSLKI